MILTYVRCDVGFHDVKLWLVYWLYEQNEIVRILWFCASEGVLGARFVRVLLSVAIKLQRGSKFDAMTPPFVVLSMWRDK